MKLHEQLKGLNRYPFHMPGHKRNPDFAIPGSNIDITEIDGFDDLHHPHGVLRETEARLEAIYKAERSFLLVNGATVGILAAIFAVCPQGSKIIIARNCHKSVYNACMLLQLKIAYLEPEFDSVNMCYTSVMQDRLDEVLSRHPDAAAAVITTPTYEGRISNLKANVPLIIDAAHGAHLGIGSFPAYPKGSLVISSLHKTLPALTQTAVLNVYDSRFTAACKRYLDIFQTSSPSYVLMNSVSLCCDYMENAALFRDYYRQLSEFRRISLHSLRLKYSDDISKIVISTENTALSGTSLAQRLRCDYQLEPEMASLNYVVLMTSVADTLEAFDRLAAALTDIDSTLFEQAEPPHRKPPVSQALQVIAYPKETEATPLYAAAGRISAEFIYAYPPDIPLLCPNEAISAETLAYLEALQGEGVNLVSESGLLPNKILTKAE